MENKFKFFVLVIVLLALISCSNSPDFEFTNEDIVKIRIQAYTYPLRTEKHEIVVSDPKKIVELLAVFNKGKITKDHKCPDEGTVCFILKGGNEYKLHYLPGHEYKYYEFRYGKDLFKVKRNVFIKAMKNAGVLEIYLPL
ncbi:MAG: hypothetical protein GY714_10750 [Desulfobacterales bacterium]|nr:hypothetical protein [Desulfobacterales bacterium]